MPAGPISKLPKSEQPALLGDLNYLNLAEIKRFCKEHGIPFRIAVATKDGRMRQTGEDDRKGVMLERVRHFVRTGVVLPQTCFAPGVVSFERRTEELTPQDRLYYGQYDKANRHLISVLKELTDGHFRNGAIARILMREFWTEGKAPTLREFASAWLKASSEHTEPNPEWAFLSDRARNAAGSDWKKMRAQKAATVLKVLAQITKAR